MVRRSCSSVDRDGLFDAAGAMDERAGPGPDSNCGRAGVAGCGCSIEAPAGGRSRLSPASPRTGSIGAPAGSFSSVRPAAESNTAERCCTSTRVTLPSGRLSPWRRRISWLPFLSCSSAMRRLGVMMMPVSSRSPRLLPPSLACATGLRSGLNSGLLHTTLNCCSGAACGRSARPAGGSGDSVRGAVQRMARPNPPSSTSSSTPSSTATPASTGVSRRCCAAFMARLRHRSRLASACRPTGARNRRA